MTKTEFKTSLLTLNNLKFNPKEKQLSSALIEALNLDESELAPFLERLFFSLISSYTFLNFKDFIKVLNDELLSFIDEKVSKTKIKNYDNTLFLQEEELLRKYYKIKYFKGLNANLQGEKTTC